MSTSVSRISAGLTGISKVTQAFGNKRQMRTAIRKTVVETIVMAVSAL